MLSLARLKSAAIVIVIGISLCGSLFAQHVDGGATDLSAPAFSSPARPTAEMPVQHRFWDRENFMLFGAVAGLSATDFAITRSNLQNGGKELDPVTRLFSGSTAGLAANFAVETAGIIGISYVFHKTGHHRLERLTSFVNITASSTAVAYDLSQKRR